MSVPCYLDICAFKEEPLVRGIVFATPSQYDVLNEVFYNTSEAQAIKAFTVHGSVGASKAAEFERLSGTDHIPPEGTLVVWFSHQSTYVMVSDTDVEIVGRLHTEGDAVVCKDRPGQTGIVLATESICTLQLMLDAEYKDYSQTLPCMPRYGAVTHDPALTMTNLTLVPNIDLGDLVPAATFFIGDPIMYLGWAGIVMEIEEEKTIRLFNNSVVIVGHDVNLGDTGKQKDAKPELYEPGCYASVRKADLRLGRWVYGKYDPNTAPRGVVVNVRTTRIRVDYQMHHSDHSDPHGYTHPDPPSDWLGLDEIDSPDLIRFDLRRVLAREVHASQFLVSHLRFADPERARAKYGSRPDAAGLFKNGRQDHLGFDMNIYKLAGAKSKVSVLWQDATRSEHDSLDLMRTEVTHNDELRPGMVVCTTEMKPLEENPTAGFVDSPRQVGIVQTYDQNTCMVAVRWFQDPTLYLEKGLDYVAMFNSKLGMLSEDVASVSTYDLAIPVGLDFMLYDYVRLRPQEVSGSSTYRGWLGVATETYPDATVQVVFPAMNPPTSLRVHIDFIEIALDVVPNLDEQDQDSEGNDMDLDSEDDFDSDESMVDDDFGLILMGDRQEAVEYIMDDGDASDAGSDHSSAWSTASEGGAAEKKNGGEPTLGDPVANETPPEISRPSSGPTFASIEPYKLHEGSVPEDHRYFADAKKVSNANLRKIMKEHTILSDMNAIPPGIFVHSWEGNCNLFRVIIIGPTETPYSRCPFVFDIHLPPAYPTNPPSVHYHHWRPSQSGADRRINPNLYEDGKVCLSLLNTWPGQTTEGWMPGQSTLLQILISIQSLILVPEPYYNEPGFEAKRNILGTSSASVAYNEQTLLQARHVLLFALENIRVTQRERAQYMDFEDTLNSIYMSPSGPRLLQTVLTEGAALLQRSETADAEAMAKRDGISLISPGACVRLQKLLKQLKDIEDMKV